MRSASINVVQNTGK